MGALLIKIGVLSRVYEGYYEGYHKDLIWDLTNWNRVPLRVYKGYYKGYHKDIIWGP